MGNNEIERLKRAARFCRIRPLNQVVAAAVVGSLYRRVTAAGMLCPVKHNIGPGVNRHIAHPRSGPRSSPRSVRSRSIAEITFRCGAQLTAAGVRHRAPDVAAACAAGNPGISGYSLKHHCHTGGILAAEIPLYG